MSASLPYFIPLPLLGFGTLGAVIRVRDRIPTRTALVDIGAAGPLAGFLVALPFLAWGYAHSQFVPTPPTGDTLLGPAKAAELQAFTKQVIAEAGLGQVKIRNLSGGIAAMHSAWRL